MLITATWCNIRNKDIKKISVNSSLNFWFPFFKKNYEAVMYLSPNCFTNRKLKLLNFLNKSQLDKIPHKHIKTLYYPCYLKRYNSLRPEVKKEIEDEYRKIISYSNQANTSP